MAAYLTPQRRLWFITNLLLLVMLGVFLAAKAYQDVWPWLIYVEAFSEAALVGGIADWFAVTALFRHPLGLPIPHTAIIPKNKKDIAESIGRFTSENFLESDAIARKLVQSDPAGLAAGWLLAPGRPALAAGALRQVLLPMLQAMDDPRLAAFARSASLDQLRRIEVAPALSEILGVVLSGKHNQAALDAVLDEVVGALGTHKDTILAKVQEQTSWWVPKWADNKIVERLIAGLSETCSDMRKPGHPWREAMENRLDQFRKDLVENPELRGQIEAFKNDLLATPDVQDRMESLWNDLRQRMIGDLQQDDGVLTGLMADVVTSLAERLRDDATFKTTVNQWVQKTVAEVAAAQAPRLSSFIQETILHWDEKTLVNKVEQEVGADLQYIRINGTVVGGLVGLLICAATHLLPAYF